MTERGLRISEVDGWKPDDLGLDASALGRLVTKLDSLLQSMLTEQDDLAETWTGAGASAAATRVVKEQTAGSHISGKIDNIKTLLTSGQTELQGAKDFVLTKRKNFVDWGFEVDDRGIVTATEKIKQLNTAGKDRSEVISAGLELMAEAGRYTMEMLGALQHAQGVAKGVQAKLAAAKSELGALVTEQAPTKAVRDLGLVPGQSTITLPPGILPEGADPVATMVKLENGIPVTFTDKDGKTTTLTPNPDNTLTVSQSVTGPDGSTTTTASTNGGPTTTTVSTPRTDGSGIVDTTVTGPDGKQQKLQTVPNGGGRTTTYAVNEDGSRGAKISESYPAPKGGTIKEVTAPNGVTEREWTRPDGYREYERYISGPDGQPKLVGTSNSAGTQSVLNADGSIDTKYSDGRWAKTITLQDGTTVTKFSDQSELKSPVSAWQTVTNFLGFEGHPNTTWGGMGASGIAAGLEEGGKSMAGQAAMMAKTSQLLGQGALDDLANGVSSPGKQMSIALQIGEEATDLGSKAKWLGGVGKFGGPLATVGFSTYNSWDDYNEGRKTGWEAIGNGVGASVGGIAGGMGVGALAGSWAGPPGVIIGAIAGGLVFGALGGAAGESAAKAVTQ